MASAKSGTFAALYDTLLSKRESSEPTPSVSPANPQEIAIALIDPWQAQPRKQFDDVAIDELAVTIREHGLLQPLLLRQMENGRYQIIAGERRWRAAQKAGLTHVPAIVRDLSEQQAAEFALIENLQRQDLSPLEEGQAFRQLMEWHGLSIRSLAERLGKSKGYVQERLDLCRLPEDLKQALSTPEATLSPGHALAIARLSDDELRQGVIDSVQQEKLNVSQTRQLVQVRLDEQVKEALQPRKKRGIAVELKRLKTFKLLQQGQELGDRDELIAALQKDLAFLQSL